MTIQQTVRHRAALNAARLGMLCLSMAFFAQGCNFKHGSSKTSAKQNLSTVLDSSDKNFEAFFSRFEVDSMFQKKRIVFPVKYTIIGDEDGSSTILIGKDKWKYLALFIANKSKRILKKTKVNAGKITVEFQIKDTGYEKDFTFTQQRGKWILTAIIDVSD